MAKLDGVRTIDMVNGEITKISYNGAEYEKVDGKPSEEAKVGDIALCSSSRTMFFSKDSYYIAEKQSGSNVSFRDNIDGHTVFSNIDERVTLFRKVEFQAPTIESLSEKVDGLAVRVTALEGCKQALSPAKEITHNGKAYELVDRKAQTGDVVVFTKNNNGFLTNGKPYGPVNEYSEVIDNEGDSLPVYRGFSGRSESNTLVYAPKVEPLKVGDYAVVIEKSNGCSLLGDIIVITEYDESTIPYEAEHIGGEYAGWHYANRLRKATDEEIAKAKAEKALAEKDAVLKRLGRNPGEYKKGDIIGYRSLEHKKVITYEITDIRDGKAYFYYPDAKGEMYVRLNSLRLSLIAPVESRVDAS